MPGLEDKTSRNMPRSDTLSGVSIFPALGTSSSASGFNFTAPSSSLPGSNLESAWDTPRGQSSATPSAPRQESSLASAWNTPRIQSSTTPPSLTTDDFPSLDFGGGLGRRCGADFPRGHGRGQVSMPGYIPLDKSREEAAAPGMGRGRGLGFR